LPRVGKPLELLLKRAQAWEEEGNLYQAIGTYYRLIGYHPGTEEADRARGQLLNPAQRLEEEGVVCQAAHLYQRLASLR